MIEIDGQRYAVDRTFDNSPAIFRAKAFESNGHIAEAFTTGHATPLEPGQLLVIVSPLEHRRFRKNAHANSKLREIREVGHIESPHAAK
jgi:hypothetical protein